ncbi:MAG: DUF2490 domain-containing protein [Bacteroidaceae bacterium]|nr:DUF2490 domain-containing protein [Bacteroidaceae bacterium]
MKRLSLFVVVFSQLLISASARADDNTGALWTEVGVTKALPYNLSVEGNVGHRTIDWFDWSSRTDVGAGLGYKPNKYVKLGFGYAYIAKHNQETWKPHLNAADNWNGYNVDAANWAQRHRLMLDVTGTIRAKKLVRFSLRERYQYTYQPARDVDRTKLRKPLAGITEGYTEWDGYASSTQVVDHKHHKNRHLLRSRLKISIDKKGWKWEPYVSVETHNDLQSGMHLDKIRTAVGVDYTINKHHEVGMGYIFNHENDDDGDQNIHAISIGYNIKF